MDGAHGIGDAGQRVVWVVSEGAGGAEREPVAVMVPGHVLDGVGTVGEVADAIGRVVSVGLLALLATLASEGLGCDLEVAVVGVREAGHAGAGRIGQVLGGQGVVWVEGVGGRLLVGVGLVLKTAAGV